MDGGGEADVGFVIAGGDATELLETAEEVLDQVAPAIDREVAGDRADAVGLGRDDGRRPSVVQVGADPVDVESLVGDQGVELDTGDQRLDADTVVALARQQDKAGQSAEGIDQGHDLGCQAAARPADGLSVGPSLCAGPMLVDPDDGAVDKGALPRPKCYRAEVVASPKCSLETPRRLRNGSTVLVPEKAKPLRGDPSGRPCPALRAVLF